MAKVKRNTKTKQLKRQRRKARMAEVVEVVTRSAPVKRERKQRAAPVRSVTRNDLERLRERFAEERVR